MDFEIVVVEIEGVAELLDGAGEIAGFFEGYAEEIDWGGKATELDGLAQRGYGFGGMFVEQRQAEVHERGSHCRI